MSGSDEEIEQQAEAMAAEASTRRQFVPEGDDWSDERLLDFCRRFLIARMRTDAILEQGPTDEQTDFLTDYLEDRYAVQRPLGLGSQGSSYLARHIDSGDRVVVKLLDLALEADELDRAIESLDHLHDQLDGFDDTFAPTRQVIHVEGFAPEGRPEQIAVVRDYLDGETLEERLQEGAPISEAAARRHLGALLDRLAPLHRHFPQLVHGNLKPSNLLLTDEGPVLLDVERVRRIARTDEPAVARTDEPAVARTAAVDYAGYEVLDGQTTPATDIYAAGALGVRMVTGRRPAELDREHGRIDFEPLCDISEPFAKFLRKSLAPRPADRFGTAQFAHNWLDQLPAVEESEELTEPTGEKRMSSEEASELINAVDRSEESEESEESAGEQRMSPEEAANLINTVDSTDEPEESTESAGDNRMSPEEAANLINTADSIDEPEESTESAGDKRMSPEEAANLINTVDSTDEPEESEESTEQTSDKRMSPEEAADLINTVETTEESTDTKEPEESAGEKRMSPAEAADIINSAPTPDSSDSSQSSDSSDSSNEMEPRVRPSNLGPSDDAVIEVVADRYKLIRPLGKGDQAITYLAWDSGRFEHVAIKSLDPERITDWDAVDQLKQEWRVRRSLSHPGIPEVYDIVDVGGDDEMLGRHMLIQEYVEGTDVATIIEQGERLSTSAAKHFLAAALEVLDYLHTLNPPVLHRDIRPDNIIRRKEGGLVLIDFGSVKNPGDELNEASEELGDGDAYTPLEQQVGRAVPASDLYALGATCVHILSHVHPAELPTGERGMDFRRVLNIEEPFARFLDRMLAPNLEHRFDSARRALEALKSPETIDAIDDEEDSSFLDRLGDLPFWS